MSAFYLPLLSEVTPERITPCPILEAILEVRFSSLDSWPEIIAKVKERIGARFSSEEVLPLSHVPEDQRVGNPNLMYLPLIKLRGDKFLVQVGPRVFSLVTKANEYSGWGLLRNELVKLFHEFEDAGFVDVVERVAVRYLNYFDEDVFPHLKMGASLSGKSFESKNLSIMTSFAHDAFVVQLNVTNCALVSSEGNQKVGSIVDLDVWAQHPKSSSLSDTLGVFDQAHQLEKKVFFGLIKDDFLKQLNPYFK